MKRRNIRRIRRDRHVDYFYSFKNASHVWVESTLELDFLYWLEFDDRVKAYATQPESADTPTGRYTPDVLVEYFEGNAEYFDPHLYKYTKAESFKKEFDDHRSYIEGLTGRTVKTVTEKDLDPTYVANLKLLYPYLRFAPKSLEKSLLLSEPVTTFGSLKGLAASLGMHPSVPFSMLAHKDLDFDKSEQLSNATILREVVT